jgi:hypothetical protein
VVLSRNRPLVSLAGSLERIERGADHAPEAETHAPSRLCDRAVALVLPVHPQQVAQSHRPYRRNVAERLPAHVPTEPLGQQQELRQAEPRPRHVRLGMKAARDDLHYVPGFRDERFRRGEGERRGGIRNGQHLGPCVAFDGVPTGGGRGEIAQREARLLVGAPPHRDRQRPRHQAEAGGGHRPDPNPAALPEPQEAKREQ